MIIDLDRRRVRERQSEIGDRARPGIMCGGCDAERMGDRYCPTRHGENWGQLMSASVAQALVLSV